MTTDDERAARRAARFEASRATGIVVDDPVTIRVVRDGGIESMLEHRTGGHGLGRAPASNLGQSRQRHFDQRSVLGIQLKGANLLTEKERAMLKSQGPVDVATFVGLVGRAVNENWIAKGEMR